MCRRRLTSWTYCSRAPNAPSACARRSKSWPCALWRSTGKGPWAQGAADGLATLQKAVELARPGGFVRVFVDLGPPMQTMLLRLAAQGRLAGQGALLRKIMAFETVRRIVAAFPEPQEKIETSDPASAMRAANASARRTPYRPRAGGPGALARAFEQPGDCSAAVPFPTTVKRHTVKLYDKLGVNRRRDAVDQGRKPEDPSSSLDLLFPSSWLLHLLSLFYTLWRVSLLR